MTSPGESWLSAYLTAWESNEPADIAAVFAEDAVYFGNPDDDRPWRGLEAITAGWIADKDEPGSWTFDGHVIVESDSTVVVQGRTDYPGGTNYTNLWVVEMAADGRATSFTEWYMTRP